MDPKTKLIDDMLNVLSELFRGTKIDRVIPSKLERAIRIMNYDVFNNFGTPDITYVDPKAYENLLKHVDKKK